MIGRWTGDARISNKLPDNVRTLPVDLTITADGTVTGTLGGAQLVDGRFKANRGALGRALNVKTDYIIVGQLAGALVPGQPTPPPRAMIPLNWRDGGFVGTVHGVKATVGITMPSVSARVKLTRAGTPGASR